jgi:hypothetical protein
VHNFATTGAQLPHHRCSARTTFPVVLLALALLTGCSSGWFGHSRGAKQSATAANRASSARALNWMQTSIDMELQREKGGQRPPSGKPSWRAYWDWRISLWHKEKHSKDYEQYFVRRRKELGLPQLKRL